MKHHYNKEELIELKRKYDMQVSKEALEEIKHTIDLDREIEDLKEQVEYQDLWRNEYSNRIDKAIEYIKKYLYIDEETGEYHLTHFFDSSNLYELLDILEGE